MRHATYGLALAALLLTACGGGAGSQSQAESAISATNALGDPMKSLTSYNAASSPQSAARGASSSA